MSIFSYAIKNITRSKGRSILIGIIVSIIAFALCIGLSIQEGALTSKENALSEMTITATISPNREAAMEKGRGPQGDQAGQHNQQQGKQVPGYFDRDAFRNALKDSLTLEELQTYAGANSVQSFYYTLTESLDGKDLDAYSTTEESSTGSDNQMGNFFGQHGPAMESQGDFSVIGYSSDEAMQDFVNGTCTITEGEVFDPATGDNTCIISSELADYNNLSVGKTITLKDTSSGNDTFKLKIVGIYENSQSSSQANAGFGGPRGPRVDPANQILVSYETAKAIDDASDSTSGNLQGTYVLDTVENYETFKKEAEELGLSSDYVVSSEDVLNYERSAQPLETLANMAGYFLIVIFLLGAIILVTFNVFSIRERKYEIGVLAAIGMKKSKIAALFVCEILIIALAGTVVGGALGAAASGPLTDTLLQSEVAAQQTTQDMRDHAFGREFGGPGGNPQGGPQGMAQGEPPAAPDAGTAPNNNGGNSGFDIVTDTIQTFQMGSAVDATVIFKLLGTCLLLALIAAAVSVITILRYEPLQIIANRD